MNSKALIAGFVAFAAAGTAAAQPAASRRGDLAGAWSVQVTLRDCATNAPIGVPFNSLVSFHRGGTLSESAASLGFAIGQRTAGHGNWSRLGNRTYRQKMVNLILFDTAPNLPMTPGFLAGWQVVTHTVAVNGDELSSSGTNAFYRSSGEVYRTGCSTATGRRIE
jgi:hypothetical protein